MYKVSWNDHAGNPQEATSDTLDEAEREAGSLNEKFDYVEISGGKTEQLFNVSIQHIHTGEKTNLQVWADRLEEATWGLWGVIGRDAQYRWVGSGPVYDGKGDVITREFPIH